MKAKITLLFLLVLASSIIIMSFNYNKTSCIKSKTSNMVSKPIVKRFGGDGVKKNCDSIKCDGDIYNIYPNLDSIKNKDLAKLLAKIPNMKIESTHDIGIPSFMDEKLLQYLFKEINKLDFKDDGLINFKTRRDGEKAGWLSLAMLPTNGKFISLLILVWEEDLDPAPSRGYYLCTFNMKGNLLSMIYVGGEEEFKKDPINRENLNFISGRVYCLNTDKPKIRKVKSWNYAVNKDNIFSMDVEAREINYFINEQGFIKTENEKTILHRTHVQWKYRAKVTFESNSDTIRKLLGEIE